MQHDRACTPHPFRLTLHHPYLRYSRVPTSTIHKAVGAHLPSYPTRTDCLVRSELRASEWMRADGAEKMRRAQANAQLVFTSVYRYGSVIICREQGLVLSIHTAVRVSTDERCQGFGRLSSVYSLILSSRESCDGAFVGARCRLYPCTALSGLYECS